MMRKEILMLCLLLVCSVAIAAEPAFPQVNINLNKLAPTNWVTSNIGTRAKPYGWDQSHGKDSGFGLTLKGPRTVRGSKGEPALEAITIYIMPKDFLPVALPPPGAPGLSSIALGRTKDGNQIYLKIWSEIETWPDVGTDIQNYFEIKTNP